jgi:quercetin dioxygenase-like cupin family protein
MEHSMVESNQRVVRIGALELRFAVDLPNVVLFEFVVPPNARVPAAHYHRDVDEIVYGLDGTLTTTIGDTKHLVPAGASRFIARGEVHTHENLHAETARALIVMTPGSIGSRYFEEMATLLNSPGKPDMSKAKEIMLRYGLVPA